jgi:hypothetical protein
MGDQASSLGDDSLTIPCFFITLEGEIQTSDFMAEEGQQCGDLEMGLELFDTEEDAQAVLDEQNALNTQECYTFDAQGVYILEDLPLLDEDNNVIPCEDLGYYNTGLGGLQDATEAFNLAYPIADFEEEGEVDTSAIITAECGSLEYCSQGGAVPTDLIMNFTSYYGTITANEVNEMLGFECYDPTTCMNINAPPPLQEGEIATATDGQNLIFSCVPQNDPNFMTLIGGVTSLSYPLWWEDFNAFIGHDCLDSSAMPVNPMTASEPESGLDSQDDGTIIDDAGSTEEPLADLDFETGGEEPTGDPTGDPTEEPTQEIFSNFVNSRKKLSQKGCTDPIALNYDEGASVDNGSCQY